MTSIIRDSIGRRC